MLNGCAQRVRTRVSVFWAVDRTQAGQFIDWMNSEQKPDQVVKTVKGRPFYSQKDYTVLCTNRLGVARLNGWGTQSFPKFPIDKFLHLVFVWSLCTSLTVSLRAYAPMPVVTFFFFFG